MDSSVVNLSLIQLDWTSIGMPVSTITLAVLTAMYVRLTKKLVEAQAEPCVIVFARRDEARPTVLQIIIKNTGKAVARDITFQISKKFPHRAFGLDRDSAPEAAPMTTGPLIDGIPALAPGEERRIDWDQYGGLSKALGDQEIEVICRFRRGTRALEPVRCVLEVKSFKTTVTVDPDGCRQCAAHLKQTADDIHLLTAAMRS
jgi:hypothetical protein